MSTGYRTPPGNFRRYGSSWSGMPSCRAWTYRATVVKTTVFPSPFGQDGRRSSCPG
jgi:hypothetical protein